MVPQPDDPNATSEAKNEETYDQLISLIENTQGRLAPIIVACDDEALRQRIVERYESEAWEAQIRPYRLVLGQEPSMRSGLEALKQQQPHLQRGGKAVFTVTGAEMLLRVKLNPQDEQSELDKFFGYLQWTREGLREFRYPIVLWVTHRILLELSRRAADFWSWRKAVLRFTAESPQVAQFAVPDSQQTRPFEDNFNTELLPLLAELQAEIAELTAQNSNALGLATLYERLGEVYTQRIRQGVAQSLEQEREYANAAFQQAINRYQAQKNPSAEMRVLSHLGNFFYSQSFYPESIAHHQKSLGIAQKLKDLDGEAISLNNLGNAYDSLGQYSKSINFYQQALGIYSKIGDRNGKGNVLAGLGNAYFALEQYPQAIDFHQQALEIRRKLGDHNGEGGSLGDLGTTYCSLGQYQLAVDLYQQALDIHREVGNRNFESNSLIDLGIAYNSLRQHSRAIDCFQQALNVTRPIGNRHNEAAALFNIANALAELGQNWEALQQYQQARQIYQSLRLKGKVKNCDAAISNLKQAGIIFYHLNQTILAPEPVRSPRIDDGSVAPRPISRKRCAPLLVYGLVGLLIALLIFWLKR